MGRCAALDMCSLGLGKKQQHAFLYILLCEYVEKIAEEKITRGQFRSVKCKIDHYKGARLLRMIFSKEMLV